MSHPGRSTVSASSMLARITSTATMLVRLVLGMEPDSYLAR